MTILNYILAQREAMVYWLELYLAEQEDQAAIPALSQYFISPRGVGKKAVDTPLVGFRHKQIEIQLTLVLLPWAITCLKKMSGKNKLSNGVLNK